MDRQSRAPEWLRRVGTLFDLIKWQHTVFALPMAIAGVALAGATIARQPRPWWAWHIALILAACFAARSSAMAYNRWLDRDVDATNPRTALRPSVTGEISPGFLLGFVLLWCAVFVGVAALLNSLALALSVPVLLVLLGYSHAKRFTPLTHLWLGAALGLAPVGAWVAITGRLDSWTPFTLALGVVFWVAGFDILYALADIEHDRREGLHSVPARLGARAAMDLAALSHCAAFGALVMLAFVAERGPYYLTGLLFGGACLLLEHRLVRPGDLSRLPVAFLGLNGLFSVAIMLGTIFDVFWHR